MMHEWRQIKHSVCLKVANGVVIEFLRDASYKDQNKIFLRCSDSNEMKNLNLFYDLECK